MIRVSDIIPPIQDHNNKDEKCVAASVTGNNHNNSNSLCHQFPKNLKLQIVSDHLPLKYQILCHSQIILHNGGTGLATGECSVLCLHLPFHVRAPPFE
jgi:hypothetical protein